MRTVKIIIFHILSSEPVDGYLPNFLDILLGREKEMTRFLRP